MSEIFEFGFEDAKVIKNQGVDQFKQSIPGQTNRISVVSFKMYHDGIIAEKTREKGSSLTDAEKAEIIAKVDNKLAEKLGKKVEELTQVDRIDVKNPRFAFAYTHYKEGIGTIRCLSKYEGGTLSEPALCCKKIGDADQTVGAVIMVYPSDREGNIDEDIFRSKKMTEFNTYKMASKKFKKVESAYKDGREDKKFTIDLKVKLDGEVKFQKQEISTGANAVWCRDDMDPMIRQWVLENGIRAWKHVSGVLGFEMKKETLAEKLGGGGGSLGSGSGSASASLPQAQKTYDDLLGLHSG